MKEMMHEDAEQDKEQTLDLIKQTLLKIVEDMTALESDRLMPEARKPKKIEVKAEIEKPLDEEAMLDEEDPAALTDLMGQADKADEYGELPEDKETGLPSEIMDVVKRKKAGQ